MAAAAPAAATANQARWAGPAAPSPERRRLTGPGGRPFPRRRGQGAGTAAQLCFSFGLARHPARATRSARRRPAGADPPPRLARLQIAGDRRGWGEGTSSPLAAGAPDVLEETATRRGGRDPATEAPGRGGSLRSRRRCGSESHRSSGGSGGGGRPPAARGTRSRFSFSWLSRPTTQALLAAGTRGHPDRGRHRRLACFRTPEGSRGHAAVTQPGSVRKPEEPGRAGGEWGDAARHAPRH